MGASWTCTVYLKVQYDFKKMKTGVSLWFDDIFGITPISIIITVIIIPLLVYYYYLLQQLNKQGSSYIENKSNILCYSVGKYFFFEIVCPFDTNA